MENKYKEKQKKYSKVSTKKIEIPEMSGNARKSVFIVFVCKESLLLFDTTKRRIKNLKVTLNIFLSQR